MNSSSNSDLPKNDSAKNPAADGVSLNGSDSDSIVDNYMKFRPQSVERPRQAALEVLVDHGVERAIKILKRKLIKEGLFKELKARRYYSKPSEEKKRRLKESIKKMRKDESRRIKNQSIF